MLIQRVLTVVLAAPFLIGAILCPSTWVFKLVVVGAILVASFEFLSIGGLPRPEKVFGIVLGVLHSLFLLFYADRSGQFLMEASALFGLVVIFYVVRFLRRTEVKGAVQRASLLIFGIFYVGTFGSFVGLLRDLPMGSFWVFTLLAVTWLNDTAAYFVGHRFGRKKLAPGISPGKTIEGFFGGFAGSVLGFLLFWFLYGRPIPFVSGFLLALLAGFFGPVGDLAESLLKRGFQVKDSGNIIPGHGGMLDRIDALLFTAPVVYFFASSLV